MMDEDVLLSSVACCLILTCIFRCGVDVFLVLALLLPRDVLDPLEVLDRWDVEPSMELLNDDMVLKRNVCGSTPS